MSGTLGNQLRRACPPKTRAALDREDPASLEALLGALHQRGLRASPAVRLEPARFLEALAGQLPEVGPRAALEGLHAEDFYLAAAAALGLRSAIAEVDQRFLSQVPKHLRTGRFTAVPADEVQQLLRERLFLGDGKLSRYSGRGPLDGWIRVVTLRAARELSQKVHEHQPLEGEPRQGSVEEPELRLFRSRHRALFKSALEDALGTLEPSQRNMLKLYFLDGLSSDAVAAMFKVDGSTVRRRLAACRKSLVANVKGRIQSELKLDSSELESLMRMLSSGFGASISRVLKQ